MLRLLRAITDDLAVLRREAAASPERSGDLLWIRGVKYTFVTAIEACMDIAQHLCASQGWGPPADNAGAIRLLGRHGVLEQDQAEVVARAVGFRNVLVHEYVAVDDDIVRSRLADLGDLETFVSAVAAWLEANR